MRGLAGATGEGAGSASDLRGGTTHGQGEEEGRDEGAQDAGAQARDAGKRRAFTQDDVARRAYELHLEGGSDAFDNWVRAERELLAS